MQAKITTLNFDASRVQPDAAFEPIPAGWYHGIITDSEVKATSAGTGAYLQVQIKVIAGSSINRVIIDRFNISNPNPVAAEIGQRQLSALCHAINVLDVRDSQMLHGKPFQFKAAVDPARTGTDGKQYDASNSVKGYKALGDGAVATGSSSTPAAAANSTPAWATNQGQADQQPQRAQQQQLVQQQPVQQVQQQPFQPAQQQQPVQDVQPKPVQQEQKVQQQQPQPVQPVQAQQANPTSTVEGDVPPWAR